jgi:hypothetical protein
MPKPKQEPTWQPLSQLSIIAFMLDGMTDSAEEQLVNLQQAEERPHVLDNATLDRLTRVYTEQQDDLWLYEEQLARWQKQSGAVGQQAEIARLDQRLIRLRTLVHELLERAQQLRPYTIDAILAKSDLELALDVLTGKIRPPTRSPGRPEEPAGDSES